MARAPLGLDVVDDQRLADATDGTPGKTVPRIAGRNENEASIEVARRPAEPAHLRVVEVGAPILRPFAARQIDQHRKELRTDIGMRLQPESVGVLAILDAQVAALETRI